MTPAQTAPRRRRRASPLLPLLAATATATSLVLLALAPHLAHAGASTDRLAGVTSKAVAAFVNDFAARHVGSTAPGLAVAVVKDGKTVYAGGAGMADQAARTQMSADSRVHAGGLAHVVAATLVLQLKDQGRIESLDDAVESYMPYKGTIKPPAKNQNIANSAAGIPLRAALSYTSGLETKHSGVWAPKHRASQWQAQGKFNATSALAFMPQRVRAALAPPVIPGDHHAYTAVAAAVAALAEQEYADFASESVFAPLGMARTSLKPHDAQDAANALADNEDAMGYAKPRGPGMFTPVDVIGTATGANALVTSANDMAQLLKALTADGKANGNRVLPKGAVESEMLKVHVPAYPGAEMGGGALAFIEHPIAGQHGDVKVLLNIGDAPGFTAAAAVVPEDRLGVFFAANADAPQLRAQFVAEFVDKFSESGAGEGSSGGSSDDDDGAAKKKKKANGGKAKKGKGGFSGQAVSVDLLPYAGTYKSSATSQNLWEAVAHLGSQIKVTVQGNSLLVSHAPPPAVPLLDQGAVDPQGKFAGPLAAAPNYGAVELVPVRASTVPENPAAGHLAGAVIEFAGTTASGEKVRAAIYPGGAEANAPAFYLATDALGHGYLATYQRIGFTETAEFVLPAFVYSHIVFAAYTVLWLLKGLVPLASGGGKQVPQSPSQEDLVAAEATATGRLDALSAGTAVAHLVTLGLATLGVAKNGGLAEVLALPRLPMALRGVFFGSFICQMGSIALTSYLAQEFKKHSPVQVGTSALVAAGSVAMMAVYYQMHLWIWDV